MSKTRINTANNNWLEIPIEDIIDNVLNYFDSLEKLYYNKNVVVMSELCRSFVVVNNYRYGDYI